MVLSWPPTHPEGAGAIKAMKMARGSWYPSEHCLCEISVFILLERQLSLSVKVVRLFLQQMWQKNRKYPIEVVCLISDRVPRVYKENELKSKSSWKQSKSYWRCLFLARFYKFLETELKRNYELHQPLTDSAGLMSKNTRLHALFFLTTISVHNDTDMFWVYMWNFNFFLFLKKLNICLFS